MATQIQCENGDVLIEQIEHVPTPGEIVFVNNTDYIVQDGPPRTTLIDLGDLGKKWVRVVKVKRALEGPTSRGEAILG